VKRICTRRWKRCCRVVFDKLPVVAQSAAPQRFLGYLEYGDLLRIYDEEMARVERQE